MENCGKRHTWGFMQDLRLLKSQLRSDVTCLVCFDAKDGLNIPTTIRGPNFGISLGFHKLQLFAVLP